MLSLPVLLSYFGLGLWPTLVLLWFCASMRLASFALSDGGGLFFNLLTVVGAGAFEPIK